MFILLPELWVPSMRLSLTNTLFLISCDMVYGLSGDIIPTYPR